MASSLSIALTLVVLLAATGVEAFDLAKLSNAFHDSGSPSTQLQPKPLPDAGATPDRDLLGGLLIFLFQILGSTLGAVLQLLNALTQHVATLLNYIRQLLNSNNPIRVFVSIDFPTIRRDVFLLVDRAIELINRIIADPANTYNLIYVIQQLLTKLREVLFTLGQLVDSLLTRLPQTVNAALLEIRQEIDLLLAQVDGVLNELSQLLGAANGTVTNELIVFLRRLAVLLEGLKSNFRPFSLLIDLQITLRL